MQRPLLALSRYSVLVEEAVVDRRDERVGHGMSEPHQKGIVAGRIDHYKVVAALDRADGGGGVGDLVVSLASIELLSARSTQ